MLKVLVIACVLIAGTPPQTNEKTAHGGDAPQAAQSDQRGTQSNPLAVDVHSVQSDKEAAEEAAKNTWEKKVNMWNIGLTLAIALCALAQVVVYLFQTRLLNQTLGEVHNQAVWMKEQTGRMSRQADLMNRQNVFARESLAVAKEAADAAKASADAAQAQIGTLKSKERAKLSFELETFHI